MGNKAAESWTKESLSASLKRLLKENDRTMADVSRALGISFPTISDWVNGRKYPRPKNIELLASYFGVPTSVLLNLEDPTTHPAAHYLGGDIVLSLLSKGYTIDLQFSSADLDFFDLANGLLRPEEKYLITDSRTMDGTILTGDEIRAYKGDAGTLIKNLTERRNASGTVIDTKSLSDEKRAMVEFILDLPDNEVRELLTFAEIYHAGKQSQ